eukprot:3360393-Rhodomonas_salina.1
MFGHTKIEPLSVTTASLYSVTQVVGDHDRGAERAKVEDADRGGAQGRERLHQPRRGTASRARAGRG